MEITKEDILLLFDYAENIYSTAHNNLKFIARLKGILKGEELQKELSWTGQNKYFTDSPTNKVEEYNFINNSSLTIKEQNMKIHGITIFKNKSCKTWYTRFRKEGKQFYLSGKTQMEVAAKLKEELKIQKTTKIIGTTFLMWFNTWLELYKINKVKNTTLADYYKTLKNIPNEIQKKNIRFIKIEDVLLMLNNITAPRAKQKAYELLAACFDKAKKHKLINENIFDLIDKPKHTKSKGIALSEKEQLKFIKATSNHKLEKLFKIILFQGLRIGEALAINYNDINLQNNTLTINKALVDNKITTTKNNQSNRIMPLFEPVKKLITFKENKNKRLFNYSYPTAAQEFKKIIKENNLPNISLHDLRHTFITNCQNENIPEHIIQTWVGHEIGSKVTSQIYTHATSEANKKNIDTLNKSKFYSNSTHKQKK